MARGKTRRPDIATLGGLALALAGIIGGLILEGGKLADIQQVTAALIVLGGTFGAVMVSMPLETVRGGFIRLVSVFFDSSTPPGPQVEAIVEYATQARRSGVVSLENEAERIEDPFLRKGLMLAVDGTDLEEIRRMLELDLESEEHRAESEAKVFEAAGGYAPTIGIIGAVMGLIQVMKHIEDVKAVGHGIAVAFVATVYGVGIANLFLLPAANKIKARARAESRRREMIVEGISAIVEGLNPKLIRARLEAYVPPGADRKVASKTATAAASTHAAEVRG